MQYNFLGWSFAYAFQTLAFCTVGFGWGADGVSDRPAAFGDGTLAKHTNPCYGHAATKPDPDATATRVDDLLGRGTANALLVSKCCAQYVGCFGGGL
jgi:hypothetical protein